MISLSKEELNRIDRSGIEYLIKVDEGRLKVWSISEDEKVAIQKELLVLKELLKKAK